MDMDQDELAIFAQYLLHLGKMAIKMGEKRNPSER